MNYYKICIVAAESAKSWCKNPPDILEEIYQSSSCSHCVNTSLLAVETVYIKLQQMFVSACYYSYISFCLGYSRFT